APLRLRDAPGDLLRRQDLGATLDDDRDGGRGGHHAERVRDRVLERVGADVVEDGRVGDGAVEVRDGVAVQRADGDHDGRRVDRGARGRRVVLEDVDDLA